MPGTPPWRRRRRVAREPSASRGSTFNVGRSDCAMTVPQCSDGLLYNTAEMARGDESIPAGRIGRTARVGQVLGSAGARYAGTRARNVMRDDDEAAAQLDQRHLETAEKMVDALGQLKGAAM